VVGFIARNIIAQDLPMLEAIYSYYDKLSSQLEHVYQISGYTSCKDNDTSLAVQRLKKFYEKEETAILDLNIGYDFITHAIWQYLCVAKNNSQSADRLIRIINNSHHNFIQNIRARKQLTILNNQHSRNVSKLLNDLDQASSYLLEHRPK
jgi:hypothetical protein